MNFDKVAQKNKLLSRKFVHFLGIKYLTFLRSSDKIYIYIYEIYEAKTVTKTVGHNEHSESRRVVRADCKKSGYPSLPSLKLEQRLEFYVSRVKGKDL